MRYLSLLIFALITYGAGLIGSLFTFPAIGTWYATLAKPELSPPNWVFGPVWNTLFLLMAIAAWRVWERRHQSPVAKKALVVYGANLVLNAFWSVAFFGLQNPTLAFGVIILLLASIAALVYLFSRVDRLAGWLFVPYLLWVSFAAYLNFAIISLNS